MVVAWGVPVNRQIASDVATYRVAVGSHLEVGDAGVHDAHDVRSGRRARGQRHPEEHTGSERAEVEIAPPHRAPRRHDDVREIEHRVDERRRASRTELIRPAVVPAGPDQVDLVVAARTVLRLPQIAVRGVDAQAERVAMAHGVRGVARAERVVRGDRPVGVQAQDLAAEVVRVLSALRFMDLAHREVQLPVASEHDVPAVVIAVLGRERVEQRLAFDGSAVRAQARQPVDVRDGVRVVDVDPRVGVERGIQREPQEPLFGRREHVDVRERIGQQAPVLDHTDVARVLLREEQAPVRGERHVRGERKTVHDELGVVRSGRARSKGAASMRSPRR